MLEPGITAVVGPNGCGKTNVSDSIRWVMGEQSAKGLRASEMTEVIFNGTDTRKPASMAEVTLTLSNDDKALPLEFSEISITRRVYRSGESEYLINKAMARLKDVRDLFMGTGLGVSAYSIMEQGKMDQIITSKPTERRALFEEAAGITRYKARKLEALRKLDATEQNLVRVADIIAEIKRQISTLERQAKQAEKFRRFKEELGKLQVLLHLDKTVKLKDKLKDLEHKTKQVNQRLEEAQGETHKLEQDEKQQRARLAQIDEELSQTREQAYKVHSEVELTQGRMESTRRHKDLLVDQRGRNEQQVTEALARIENLKIWIAERRQMVANKENQKAERETQKRGLVDQLSSLEGDLNAKNQDLESKNSAAVDLVTKAAQMRAELESLRSQDAEVSKRIQDVTDQINQVLTGLADSARMLEEFRQSKITAQAEEAQIDETILGYQSSLSQQENLLDEINSSLRQLNNQHSEVRSRYGVLQELQNKLTGYDSGVKAVLQAKQNEPLMWQEVLGVVADLLSVDQSLEGAVENLLGSQLQSLVVKNRGTAAKVVEFLKAEGQGKVSLLVLEDLLFNSGTAVPSGEGHVGPLPESVKFLPELEPMVRFLLGDGHLVEDWSAAERLSGIYPTQRFVTPEGDRQGPRGSWKAGSAVTGFSLLGRHREMTELNDRLKTLDGEIQSAEQKLIDSKKTRKDTEDALLAAEARRQQLKIFLAETEKEFHRLDETKTRLEGEKTELEKERQGLEVHWQADKNRVDQLSVLLSQSEQAQHLTQDEIAEARKSLQNLQGRREELSRLVVQAELELAAMDEVALRAQEEADRYQVEQDQLTHSVTLKNEENQQLESQDRQLSLDLNSLEEKAGGLTNFKKEADEKVQAVLIQRETIAAETEERIERVKKSRVKLEEIQRELNSFAIQEAQFNVEIRNYEEKLQVEYKVDLDNPPVHPEEGFDAGAAETQCIELRAKIDRLGLVNMVAMEEYDELSQRYKFLTEQQEDLLKAKDDLQKAINKINLTSKELFTSTFATVQENFKDIFQRLFEGGRAELILIDEGDVLESGIEIVARPPGKRLQSIFLLSGGEKALTAIALLFALFMVKPSPFCLLDEIDAPLDDVNVGRFTHLLKEFSKRTQFIMITHNKVSMETGDILYGVTMQESGVSKIISTKFKENKPEETTVG